MNDGSKKGLNEGALQKLFDEAEERDRERGAQLLDNLKKMGFNPPEKGTHMGKGIKDYAVGVVAIHDIVTGSTEIQKRIEGDADYETALEVHKETADLYNSLLLERDDPSKIIMVGFNEVVETAYGQQVVANALGLSEKDSKEVVKEAKKAAKKNA